TVKARAGMMKVTHLDQLLHIVGDVRAKVIPAGTQFPGCQFLVADIVKQESLNGIDVAAPAPVKLILNHIEQAAMQTLDQCQSFYIGGADFRLPHRPRLRTLRLENAVHDPSLLISGGLSYCPGPSMDRFISNANEDEFK